MTQKKHLEFLKICREIGWKCTSQRLAVYDFLTGSRSHPNVDDVWMGVQTILPTITRESVYRILNEFSGRGIIVRLDHIESARYDSRTGPHGHFICEKCGTISDFDLSEEESFPCVKLPGKMYHMEFRAVGLCEKCVEKEKKR